jgi:hypothetical protein
VDVVVDAVAGPRPGGLRDRELSLEQLATAPDRAEGIALDDEDRRVGRQRVAATRSDLLRQRSVYAAISGWGVCLASVSCANAVLPVKTANTVTRTVGLIAGPLFRSRRGFYRERPAGLCDARPCERSQAVVGLGQAIRW